jgi:cytochrome c peroxidase
MKRGCLKLLLIASLFAAAAGSNADPLNEPIKPLPLHSAQNPSRVAIGRHLFQDARLSVNGRVSCASCHNLAKGGADDRGRSVGFNGQLTAVNTPTVLNAALNFRQFWNGRAATLEDQVDAVVQNPTEMGSKWTDVVTWISSDPDYHKAFAASYGDGVTRANIESAIATYERTLITPNSPFDRYLLGDTHAISAEQKAGYQKFKQYGCIACHQGVNVGGNMFQKFGVMGDYFANRGNPTEADLGRYLVTREETDRHVFKVPGLRNVALNAPYFHDGSAATLGDAVDIMFKYQLGRLASAEDKTAIVQFLNSLTGQLPTGAP